MADPDDAPRAACPECGGTAVIAEAPCLVLVLAAPAIGGTVYGNPRVLPLPGTAPAACNSAACGWRGKVSDARPDSH